MEIRSATRGDIPAIVSLLKLTLGESLMPKSERYWEWKHLESPFGESPVMLAFEGATLIGVRAFMRWQWVRGNERMDAIRGVDTATHPDFQGRGIFKKLTLNLVDQCTKNGWHFIFNTPNKFSMPGYLKMGWEKVGRLPIDIRIERPFSVLMNAAFRERKVDKPVPDDTVKGILEHPGLNELLAQHKDVFDDHIITPHSIPFLKWRYQNVPVTSYSAYAITEGNSLNALIFYRLKSTSMGRELRIAEVFIKSDKHDKDLHEAIHEKAKQYRADYVTASAFSHGRMTRGTLGIRNLRLGPMVTTRELSTKIYQPRIIGFKDWSPSIGDLELF